MSGASGILSSSTSINRGGHGRPGKRGGAGNESRESGVDEPTNKRISLIGSKGQLLPVLLQCLYLAGSKPFPLWVLNTMQYAEHLWLESKQLPMFRSRRLSASLI